MISLRRGVSLPADAPVCRPLFPRLAHRGVGLAALVACRGEAAPGALLLIFERSAGAYIVLSVLTGARTEELRALAWSHVDLIGDPDAAPPVPPHMMVWRSVRAGGDTKTRRSRRTLALPQRCVSALRQQRVRQAAARRLAGVRWQEHDLLFASQVGTPLDAANARRDFRKVATTAGLPAKEWTPRELRNSFVSLFVRRRHADRTDLPARRAQRDDGHGTRLPEADPPGGRARRHGDGPDLPARGDVVTQFVTRPLPRRRTAWLGTLSESLTRPFLASG